MYTEKDLIGLIEKMCMNNEEKTMPIKQTENMLDIEPVLKEKDGFIEVRGQQLFVIDPKEGGRYPVLLPNPNLKILVNDRAILTEVVVTAREKIKVLRDNIPKTYEIIVSEDKISVFLKMNIELFTIYKLKDIKRSNKMMLEMEASPFQCNIEETSSKIMEEILKKGIKVDVDSTAIVQELLNPTFKQIKVAEGLPSIPSVDAVLKKYFSTDLSEVIEEVDGVVDFKNRLKIPNVTPGQLIAKLYPPKEGKAGYNVFSQTLQPEPPKKIEIRLKPRVRLTDDGEIIALQQGRPSITGYSVKHVDIIETYEVNGDVDMTTGNIFFHGDIIIRGHIKDNMTVESSGSIFVLGNVYQAKVIAPQDVKINGTVVNSIIIAGQLSMFYNQFYKKAQDLSATFKKLINSMIQLEKSMKEKKMSFDFGYAFVTLVEMKFTHFINDVIEVENIIKESLSNQLEVKFRILLNTLVNFKSFYSLRNIQSIDTLISIQFSINELIDELDSMIKVDSSIHVKSATFSTLKTNGEIVVKKDGVVQCQLFAGTNIVIEDEDSSIRGGKLEAMKEIRANRVGTEMGALPELYAYEKMHLKNVYQAHIKMPFYNKIIDQYNERIILIYDEKAEQVKLC